MNDSRPFLLVRAHPKAAVRDRFETWFRTVHLEDVKRIPGIVSIKSGTTAGGTKLGFYTFDSTDVVQASLSSAQAAYARGTWEQWAPHLDELLIEIYAALFPLPIYHSMS